MVLCDTNILIEFYKHNLAVVEELRHIKLPNIAISTITQAELYVGAINRKELATIKKHLAKLHVFTIDPILTMLDYPAKRF